MLRFVYLVARNLYKFPWIIGKMRKMTYFEKYTEEECYEYLQSVIGMLQRTGHVKTAVHGEENLPKEGGYAMYANHQGKYDAYGIVSKHKKTCTVVMDKAKS